jgi:excisionase family DNA binding protein
MTTKELAGYLKLHAITICKYAANGQIPAMRIGRVWRFDKEAIDAWIIKGQSKTQDTDNALKKAN